jgi:acetyl/propionyl-CoA carboxylase alpha subunit
MRRALGEYVITGIRTTIPFFSWLLSQPDFAEGRFHTTYLDELLRARNGQPFAEVSPNAEALAAVAAAISSVLGARNDGRATDSASNAATGRWASQARTEGLR